MVDKTFDVWNVPPLFDPRYNAPTSIAAIPGDELSVIVTMDYGSGFIYRDGILANSYASKPGRDSVIEPGDPLQGLLNRGGDGKLLPPSDTTLTLYSVDPYKISRLRVDSNGVTDLNSSNTADLAFLHDVKSDSGQLFANTGQMLDPTDLSVRASMNAFISGQVLHPGLGYVVPDVGRNIVQFFGDKIRVFDATTYDLKYEMPTLLNQVAGSFQYSPMIKIAPDTLVSTLGDGVEGRIIVFYKEPKLNPYQAPTAPSTVTQLVPASADSQSGNLLLHVNGSGFTPGSYVMWNGKLKTTSFVSTSALVAYIPPSDLAQPGVANVTVGNPETAASSALQFMVNTAGVTVQPRGLKFGTAVSNRPSAWQSIGITNNGTSSISIAPSSPANTAYELSTNCGQLPPGGSCAAAVRFRPTATGDQFGALNVQVGTNAVPVVIPLSGSGFDFNLNFARPTRTHRGGQAASAVREVEISLDGGATTPQTATLSCAVPSREYSCRLTPPSAPVGGSLRATVTLERRTSRRLNSAPDSLPITISATSNGLTRSIIVP